MKFETTFSCGDRAWVFDGTGVVQCTIGQVRVEHTDSPGTGSDFDNYAEQHGHEESYMCVETGIGSGSVYTLGEHIFESEEACLAAHAARVEEIRLERVRKDSYERNRKLANEARLREQLAEIERIKAAMPKEPQS